MYKIIGADQKEYGPVSAELLRQWVSEGRVNAQTMAKLEGEGGDWKPLSTFPEFADALRSIPASGAPLAGADARSIPVEAILGRDYELDIGSCIVRGWELLKQYFWPVVGISFLVLTISFVMNQAIGLVFGPAIQGSFRRMFIDGHFSPQGVFFIIASSVLGTPVYMLLTGGLFKYYLKLMRAEGPTIADAFSGFSPIAGQLILLGLVSGLLSSIGYVLCVLPGIYLTVAWLFALPLVIDRNMPFWEAMELSRRVVGKHWFITFAFLLVIGLLAGCGIIACCVGVFVTAPLSSLALLYAYEDIFGRAAS